MNKVEIAQGSKRLLFNLPSAWEELTARQVMAVCRIYRRELDETRFKLLLCMALTPKKARRTVRRELGRLQGRKAGARGAASKAAASAALVDFQSQLLQLSDTLDFLKQHGVIKVNPAPAVRVGLSRLYGCSPDLSSCTYEQYAGADVSLRQVAGLQKSDAAAAHRALCRGLACLWLPRVKTPAAMARALTEESIARRSLRIARVRPALLEAMFLTAQSGMRQVVERFPSVFTSSGKDEDPWGHAGLIVTLAGDKFGDVEKTAATKLYTLLMYVEMKVAEAEKITLEMTNHGK
jgi:hypothetical protein